jgi:hypothetical protein
MSSKFGNGLSYKVWQIVGTSCYRTWCSYRKRQERTLVVFLKGRHQVAFEVGRKLLEFYCVASITRMSTENDD